MKNQDNNDTVKDGLPTADALIEDNLGGLELTMDDEMWKFYRHVIRQCMQSYSDQQNAELREELKLSEDTIKHQAERCLRLEERVKELEGLVLEYKDGYSKILNALNK